ncbi:MULTISPECIES: nitroreductase family protein [Ignavibacterium]|jgi:nitroreductase|uniref:nitroreductase family protein n=1 Tax=Ignavibacterium TaxID=795750 RepID=UPI0025BE3874|nr:MULTISPECIES: nitroreductase family protein [Ignavibacterium]MBI5661716.1 nitroreductase family protein [Ignavibacterium album]
METLLTIINRRSIRKYKPVKIEEEKINLLLKAAMHAPSAMNLKPWHFIVINSEEVIKQTVKSVPHAEMIKQSGNAILICGDSSVEKNESWLIQDCSAATQNILLTAYDSGLGSCWIAVHGMNDMVKNLKTQFNLPDEIIPFALVAFGYPDEEVKTEQRFKEEKIHYNNW